MRYDDKDRESDNVEDRRSQGGGGGGFRFPGGGGRGIQIPMGRGGGGFSITTLLIVGAIMLLFGLNPLDLLPKLLPVYVELLARLARAGAPWVQIDESAAVTDNLGLSAEQIGSALTHSRSCQAFAAGCSSRRSIVGLSMPMASAASKTADCTSWAADRDRVFVTVPRAMESSPIRVW